MHACKHEHTRTTCTYIHINSNNNNSSNSTRISQRMSWKEAGRGEAGANQGPDRSDYHFKGLTCLLEDKVTKEGRGGYRESVGRLSQQSRLWVMGTELVAMLLILSLRAELVCEHQLHASPSEPWPKRQDITE